LEKISAILIVFKLIEGYAEMIAGLSKSLYVELMAQ